MEVQRTREKALYWKSLNPVFKVDLHGHFRSRLELPPYFSENVKGKLPRKVTLKGPGTDIDTWDVLVTTSTDTTSIIGEGWRSFVAAFGLEENDTLVFKYKKESCFKVRVISGKTLCEKESSHFVAVPNPGGDKLMMKRETERSEEDYGLKERNADAALLHYKRDYSTDYEVIPAEVTESSGSLYTQSRKRSAEAFASPPGVQVKAECTPNSSQSDRLRYAEQRERVSDRAKRIQMCTENSFFISLSRSHVSGAHVKFCIPRKWWEMVIKAKKNQSIRLCRKGEDQSKSHLCYCVYDEKYNTATVTRGWKDFVQENTLQENDCCVFKLAKPWKELEVISLEVEIIRADK